MCEQRPTVIRLDKPSESSRGLTKSHLRIAQTGPSFEESRSGRTRRSDILLRALLIIPSTQSRNFLNSGAMTACKGRSTSKSPDADALVGAQPAKASRKWKRTCTDEHQYPGSTHCTPGCCWSFVRVAGTPHPRTHHSQRSSQRSANRCLHPHTNLREKGRSDCQYGKPLWPGI